MESSQTSGGVLRRMLSIALASALSALVLWASTRPFEPALLGAALFLFLVVQQDVLRTRIPNAVTLPGLALALAGAAWLQGWSGLLWGLLGAGLVFVTLFLPFAIRALGAGDVKALMVLGALFGPAPALGILSWAVLFGAVLALGLLISRKGLGEMLERWGASLGATLASRSWVYLRPPAGAAARTGLPFAVPIALGVAALQRWGAPWSLT